MTTELNFQYCPTKFSFIDRISELEYNDFFENYLKPNKPCIATGLIQNWNSVKEWVNVDGLPDIEFLASRFGSTIVPVADCNTREYNSQQKIKMYLSDYLDYWKKLNQEKNNEHCLYLKDWHFNKDYPKYEAYLTPEYYHSDWLNEFCEKEDDDYKFVYMGPKGTWTPLHADVFGSYSWSANICGKKLWLLFPPGEEKLLKDERNQPLYLLQKNAVDKFNAHCIEVIQEAGEVIFVPSGWHHQVQNLEDTISINHNWFNGCNILHIWQCLKKAANDVENEISDCKNSEDWEDQCQIILRVHHGINYDDFLKILKFIYESRSTLLHNNDYTYTWEISFDILSIKNVCLEILSSRLPNNFIEKAQLFYKDVDDFVTHHPGIKYL